MIYFFQVLHKHGMVTETNLRVDCALVNCHSEYLIIKKKTKNCVNCFNISTYFEKTQ